MLIMNGSGQAVRWLGTVLIVLSAAAAQGQTQLAKDGQAAMPVIVSADASERVREAATDLADYLERISRADFETRVGDGRTGIAVGTLDEFPNLGVSDMFDAEGVAGHEQYLLRSHADGIYVIGATPLAAQHGVWDLLHRLGYRQFYPGDTWEIVPEQSDLTIEVDAIETPDYLTRRISYGFGLWDYNKQPYDDWQARNRAASDFILKTGHAYGQIYNNNKEAFDTHPEYFAKIDGKREHRGNVKFCISNPDARDLIVKDRLNQMRRLRQPSISMDPSDGGGWCACDECAAIGSISDQAVWIANEVAEALVAEFGPDVYVGMYAYNQHSPPPNIEVHPNVIVSIATAFIRGGYTIEQLIEGWSRRGASLGVREYYSLNKWNRDMPGRSRASNLDYLARTVPYFHDYGARFMTAESSDTWGLNGLGYYFAARMMWDVNEATQLDEIKTDFYDKAFGEARSPMQRFYELLDGSNRPLLSDDLVGRMYRLIDEASNLTDDPAVQARLDDLTLYTYYVELYRDYDQASGSARQAAFETLIRHAYRMRQTMMVHIKALYRSLAPRDDVTIPAEAAWNVPEANNPWKSSEPFSRTELDRFIADGIANHDLLSFTPVAFSEDLMPADPLNLPENTLGKPDWRGRGDRVYYTWVNDPPAEIRLKMTGGLIARYRDRGDVHIQLFPADEVQGLAVDEASIPPDGETREVVLRTEHAGLHRIEFSDGNDMTRIAWESDQPMTAEISTSYALRHVGQHSVCFYVPRGTEVVGGYAGDGKGAIHDSQGSVVHQFKEPGYFEVPVPPGQDGKLWSLQRYHGQVKLMTVPPYVSPSAAHLLLPREVVEADAE